MICRSDNWRFNINPIAASRPRISQFGAYFSGPYKKFRLEANDVVLNTIGNSHNIFNEGVLTVVIELFVTKPKTTILDFPRPDVDNYAKAILDVCNEKIWDDDQRITNLVVSKSWANLDEEGYFTLSVSNNTY